jgi:hypothetical protein
VAHDVFISYSHHDKPQADAVCATLEAKGIRCWIAPRDVIPGQEWGEAIVDAIRSSRVMVLVFSSHANDSPQIRREVQLAVSAEIVLIPFRIEDVAPARSLEYFLGAPHWLDAMTPPLGAHLEHLAVAVATFVGVIEPAAQAVVEVRPRTSAHTVPSSGSDASPGAVSQAVRSASKATSQRQPTRATLDDALAEIGAARLSGVPRHDKLPEADRQVLSELAAQGGAAEIIRRINMLLKLANESASRGVSVLTSTLGLGARGLGWIQETLRLLPNACPLLREAFARADPWLNHVRWLDTNWDSLNLTQAPGPEDYIDDALALHEETRRMLQADSADDQAASESRTRSADRGHATSSAKDKGPEELAPQQQEVLLRQLVATGQWDRLDGLVQDFSSVKNISGERWAALYPELVQAASEYKRQRLKAVPFALAKIARELQESVVKECGEMTRSGRSGDDVRENYIDHENMEWAVYMWSRAFSALLGVASRDSSTAPWLAEFLIGAYKDYGGQGGSYLAPVRQGQSGKMKPFVDQLWKQMIEAVDLLDRLGTELPDSVRNGVRNLKQYL